MNYEHLVESYRSREDYQREENSLLLRIRAMCRRHVSAGLPEMKSRKRYLAKLKTEAEALHRLASKAKAPPALQQRLAPMLTWYGACQKVRKEHEKAMLKTAAIVIPPTVQAWAKTAKGLGPVNLAKIAAEAKAPLTEYAGPARLWKRFGLACIDGQAQRRVKDEELAIRYGFAPKRRAAMHVVGECLIRARGQYGKLYRERKELERQKEPAAKPILHHRRAMRFMEKRLLRDLWVAWNNGVAK